MLRWDWNNWWRHVLNYYTTFSYKSLYLISILGTRTDSWSNTSTVRGKINRFRAHSCHRRNLSSLAAETSSSSLKITGSGRAEKIPCTSPIKTYQTVTDLSFFTSNKTKLYIFPSLKSSFIPISYILWNRGSRKEGSSYGYLTTQWPFRPLNADNIFPIEKGQQLFIYDSVRWDKKKVWIAFFPRTLCL